MLPTFKVLFEEPNGDWVEAYEAETQKAAYDWIDKYFAEEGKSDDRCCVVTPSHKKNNEEKSEE